MEEVCVWVICVIGCLVLFCYICEEEFIVNIFRYVVKVIVKLGVKKDGRLTVVKMDFCVNIGFYGNYLFIVSCNGLVLSLSLYLCDNVDF